MKFNNRLKKLETSVNQEGYTRRKHLLAVKEIKEHLEYVKNLSAEEQAERLKRPNYLAACDHLEGIANQWR